MKGNEFTVEDEIRELMKGPQNDEAPTIDDAQGDQKEIEESPAENLEQVEEPVQEPVEPVQTEVKSEAPTALTGAIKAKWNELPEDVRAEWKKREDDIQAMMTRHDGDLKIGREMKEVITPYMAIIQSEGGTPVGAVRDLLNTAYILRTGSPGQKAQLLHQVAQQYGVDLNTQPQQVDLNVHYLQTELHQLRQQANPERIKEQLQEEMQRDRINSEIQAFAANSKNVHFEAVRTQMGALMGNGQAKDLQEAYDMACWASPTIRASLLQAQDQERKQKQKQEVEAKKKAASSVTGSPGLASPQSREQSKSLEDELREQLQAARGVAI